MFTPHGLGSDHDDEVAFFVTDGNHRARAVKEAEKLSVTVTDLPQGLQQSYRAVSPGMAQFRLIKGSEATRVTVGRAANSVEDQLRAHVGASDILTYLCGEPETTTRKQMVTYIVTVFKLQDTTTVGTYITGYMHLAGRGRLERGKNLGGPEVVQALQDLLLASLDVPGDPLFFTHLKAKVVFTVLDSLYYDPITH